jgi:type I restriction-modification system DNA methylase subunit
MATTDELLLAFQLFEAANKQDPNTEIFEGTSYPKEVLYGIRMTERLHEFAPNASEALQLAARCQHICRWEISRESYAMNREGYLRWRQDLKIFHARKASSILQEVGYNQDTIAKVCFLLEKKQLKKNDETQTIEDVICLVFLEYYFEPFALKHPEDKTIEILKKTWRKMSVKGQEAALKLPLSKYASELIFKALSQ